MRVDKSLLATAALAVMAGCSSDDSLGTRPTGGTSGVIPASGGAALGVTGGAAALGGRVGTAGAPASGGTASSGGGAAPGSGGLLATGGKTSPASGGSVQPAGGTGSGGQAYGGSLVAGGQGGVILIASVTGERKIQGTWQNGTESSIFLYGCGSVDTWKLDSAWVKQDPGIHCSWEGVSPEVPAGSSYSEVTYKSWGAGTYRLSGRYGVGCTNPELGQSKAGCTAYYEVTSNQVTLSEPPSAGGAGGATGSGGAGVQGGTTAAGGTLGTGGNAPLQGGAAGSGGVGAQGGTTAAGGTLGTGGNAPLPECGNVGLACSGDDSNCGEGMYCFYNTPEAPEPSACVPNRKPCGGVAGWTCTEPQTCLWIGDSDAGICLTNEERGCICASSIQGFFHNCPNESVDRSLLHQPCTADEECPAGLVADRYYADAGVLPLICTCEIECMGDPLVCPSGTTCVYTEGPGWVCT